MAFGLAAYVSRCRLPVTAQGSLPGAPLKLSWAGFHPQGSRERFPTYIMLVLLLSQASWHNPLFFPLFSSREYPISVAQAMPALTYPRSSGEF
jgi:hypothetical protein